MSHTLARPVVHLIGRLHQEPVHRPHARGGHHWILIVEAGQRDGVPNQTAMWLCTWAGAGRDPDLNRARAGHVVEIAGYLEQYARRVQGQTVWTPVIRALDVVLWPEGAAAPSGNAQQPQRTQKGNGEGGEGATQRPPSPASRVGDAVSRDRDEEVQGNAGTRGGTDRTAPAEEDLRLPTLEELGLSYEGEGAVVQH